MPGGLSTAYAKYKAIVLNIPAVIALGTDDEWKAQLEDPTPWIPHVPQFIDIFVAKSQYYDVWRPKFRVAETYPDMKNWLEQKPDALSNKELWGTRSKSTIGFPDLTEWLVAKEAAALITLAKGKSKAVSASPSKGKGKGKGRDAPVLEKKPHKKSKKPETESEESE